MVYGRLCCLTVGLFGCFVVSGLVRGWWVWFVGWLDLRLGGLLCGLLGAMFLGFGFWDLSVDDSGVCYMFLFELCWW